MVWSVEVEVNFPSMTCRNIWDPCRKANAIRRLQREVKEVVLDLPHSFVGWYNTVLVYVDLDAILEHPFDGMRPIVHLVKPVHSRQR